jgi:hypothetical protein
VSTSFVVPFRVTLPDWVSPCPAAALPHFVTWESPTLDRSIRFLAPGDDFSAADAPSAPSAALLHSFLGASHDGVTIDDVVETIVDGWPATVMAAQAVSGGDARRDRLPLLPDLIMHIAVIDIGGWPLLVWIRETHDGDEAAVNEDDSFAAMLASLQLMRRAQPASQPPSTGM